MGLVPVRCGQMGKVVGVTHDADFSAKPRGVEDFPAVCASDLQVRAVISLLLAIGGTIALVSGVGVIPSRW